MLSEHADELIDGCEYPATCEAVQNAVGDATVDHANGSESVAAAIGLGGGTTFESAEDVHLALYSGLSGEAVGRKGYSDRDPGTLGTEEPTQVSF